MRRLLILSAALLSVATAPAGADWLVTRAGGRIETQGPWQVKGKLVVFTGKNGTLVSLRLADVDLAASDAATAEAKQAKEKAEAPEAAKPPERKKSVRSLTDADFSRKPPGSEEGAAKPDDTAKTKDSAAKPQTAAGTVVVESWSKANRAEGDGIDIFGTLRNNGKEMAADIVLKVTLLNEAKETVGTGQGILAATSLTAGGTTSFRVPFAGVFAFAQAQFEVTNRTIPMTPAPDAAAAKKKAPPPNDEKH